MSKTTKTATVITLQSVANYGTQLQAFATQEKLKQYFSEVTFINYRRPDTYGKGLVETFAHGNLIKILAILPTIKKWEKVFGDFQEKNLNISTVEYPTIESFENFQDCVDVYFSGSDQVWNTGWNKGIIPPFYLSFVPENKPRYAYASSFGMEKLEESDVPEIRKYLEKFRAISVREDGGAKILEEQLKLKNVERILDPTLMFSGEFWRKYASELKIKKPYILVYNLNRNKDFDEYAKEMARRTGLPVYRFCTRYDQILRYGKSLLIPEIFEFITLIDNAEYVLTDSFHATAFSVNLNTKPICLYPKEYSGRISDFLALVHSEKSHPKSYQDFSVLEYEPDFKKIGQILEQERQKGDRFLQNIVNNEEGKKGVR